MVDAKLENLGQYVRRIMKQKGLTQQQIEERSEHRITSAYVASICTGRAKNLSIEKLKGLALGLGVDLPELIQVAYNLSDQTTDSRTNSYSDPALVLYILQKVVAYPELMQVLQDWSNLPAKKQREIVRAFQKTLEARLKPTLRPE